MGMSYRAAWGRMKQTETLIAPPRSSARSQERLQLTPLGHEVVRLFSRLAPRREQYALNAPGQLPRATNPYIEEKH
jgi:molybdate transport system regulatory protein